MSNFGEINQDKLRELAQSAGISERELDQALEENNLTGLYFSA